MSSGDEDFDLQDIDDDSDSDESDSEEQGHPSVFAGLPSGGSIKGFVLQLQDGLQKAPFDAEMHIALVGALREAADLKRLRTARCRAAAKVTLPESVWLDWLQDEGRLADESGFAELDKLHSQACAACPTAKIWLARCQLYSERHAADASAVRAVFEDALNVIGLHPLEGPEIWSEYRSFEEDLMQTAGAAEQIQQVQRVRTLFFRQLTVPLPGIARLQEAYETFERSLEPAAANSTAAAKAEAIAAKAVAAWSQRAAIEQRLLDACRPAVTVTLAGTSSARTDSPSSVSAELLALDEASGDLGRGFLGHLRATQHAPHDASRWRNFAKFASATMRDHCKAAEALERAVRYCPRAGDLWLQLHLESEAAGQSLVALRDVLDRALAAKKLPAEESNADTSGASSSCSVSEQDLLFQHADAARRRAAKEGGDAQCDCWVHMRTALEQAVALAQVPGDDGALLSQALLRWMRLEAYAARNAKAVLSVGKRLMQLWGGYYNGWSTFIAAVLFCSGADASETVRGMYMQAMASVADYPEQVRSDYVQFEREFGTLQSWRKAQQDYQQSQQAVAEAASAAADTEEQLEHQQESARHDEQDSTQTKGVGKKRGNQQATAKASSRAKKRQRNGKQVPESIDAAKSSGQESGGVPDVAIPAAVPPSPLSAAHPVSAFAAEPAGVLAAESAEFATAAPSLEPTVAAVTQAVEPAAAATNAPAAATTVPAAALASVQTSSSSAVSAVTPVLVPEAIAVMPAPTAAPAVALEQPDAFAATPEGDAAAPAAARSATFELISAPSVVFAASVAAGDRSAGKEETKKESVDTGAGKETTNKSVAETCVGNEEAATAPLGVGAQGGGKVATESFSGAKRSRDACEGDQDKSEQQLKKAHVGSHYHQKRLQSGESVPVKPETEGDHTIYVSNLDWSVDEPQLHRTFGEIDGLKEVRLVRDFLQRSKGYAYIDFHTSEQVEQAVEKLNGTLVNKRPLRVARSLPTKPLFEERTVFVQNIPQAAGEEDLRGMFAASGEIADIRLPMDSSNEAHKGYAYIEFAAADSISPALALDTADLKGQPLSVARSIPMKQHRHQTAGLRKDLPHRVNQRQMLEGRLQREDPVRQASRFPTTVHVKNLAFKVDEAKLRDHFAQCGTIAQVLLVRDLKGKSRGFAFVEFETPEAAQAALLLTDSKLNGRDVVVSTSQRGITQKKVAKESSSQNEVPALEKAPEKQTASIKAFRTAKAQTDSVDEQSPMSTPEQGIDHKPMTNADFRALLLKG